MLHSPNSNNDYNNDFIDENIDPLTVVLTIKEIEKLNSSTFLSLSQDDFPKCACKAYCRVLHPKTEGSEVEKEDKSCNESDGDGIATSFLSNTNLSIHERKFVSNQLGLYYDETIKNWRIIEGSNNTFQMKFPTKKKKKVMDYDDSLMIHILLQNNDDDVNGTLQVPIMKKDDTSQLNRSCMHWVDLMSSKGETVGRIRISVSIQSNNLLLGKSEVLDPSNISSSDASATFATTTKTATSTSNNKNNNPAVDTFNLEINFKKVHNMPMQQYQESPFWISYEFLGAVVQSERFNPSPFEPKEDVFQLNLTQWELISFLERNKIKIYLCGEGAVVGRAEITLYTAFDGKQEEMNEGEQFVEGWIAFHVGNDDNLPVAATKLCRNETDDFPQILVSMSICPSRLFNDNLTIEEVSTRYAPCLNENENDNLYRQLVEDNLYLKQYDRTKDGNCINTYPSEEQLLQKIKDVATGEINLEKKQRQWKEFRHKEEIKFREHLRKKEELVRRRLEEQMKGHQSEQVRAIETCRNEYKILESRLKTALSEVEAKEREMKRKLATNHTTFLQKIAEFDLKEKVIREEAKHIVDMEVCMFKSDKSYIWQM